MYLRLPIPSLPMVKETVLHLKQTECLCDVPEESGKHRSTANNGLEMV